jgi:ketosteroid isomerase-like protein
MDMGVKAAKLESVEIEGHGTTAIEVGKYELYAAGKQMVDKGKYIVVWKQEHGEWRLARDIWNTSLPPPA